MWPVVCVVENIEQLSNQADFRGPFYGICGFEEAHFWTGIEFAYLKLIKRPILRNFQHAINFFISHNYVVFNGPKSARENPKLNWFRPFWKLFTGDRQALTEIAKIFPIAKTVFYWKLYVVVNQYTLPCLIMCIVNFFHSVVYVYARLPKLFAPSSCETRCILCPCPPPSFLLKIARGEHHQFESSLAVG